MDESLIREQEAQLQKTGRYYKHICFMAVPVLCMACFLYGVRPLLLCGIAVLTGNLCDRLVSLLRRRVYQGSDFSNESFALVIALLMPVTVDIYVLIAAVLAGVLIGKEIFGGYGSYPFNPAAVGYVVAAVSWPEQVFRYPQPYTNIPLWDASMVPVSSAIEDTLRSGGMLNIGGITQRIINFCMELLRPIRGGLGEVNIVASMIFGGISGSSVADTSALGSILIPAMEKEGYPPEASAGITVASSTMGMIIPPSTPMIVYSMISGASVGALFVAGAVPGILIGLTQLVLVYIISAKKGWHPEKIKFDGKRAAKSLLSGIPALIMPLFIIICVSFGVCTASESAGVAVLYSMLVGFFVYKELTWKGVWEALKKTLISSSSIMLIIGFTTIFTWVLTMQKVPQTVGAFFMSLNMPAWAIALIFDVLILMIGTFIDVSPAILLLTPILLPVMVQYGFSPLQFGAMMITGLAIGLVTPPVGMCLNACNKINRMPIIEIFKGAAPYVICNVIVLISISLWGPLTTALPQLLGYSIF